MITDRYNTFALDVALNTGAAGDYIIGDWIDIGALRDIGQGNNLFLVMQMSAAATSGGSATLQMSLVSNTATPLVTSGASVHAQTGVFPLAQLTLGRNLLTMVLPLEGIAYQRYVGIRQTTGTAAFTGGKIDAFLTPTPAKWRAYADGVN
jgi:hypothetical protein